MLNTEQTTILTDTFGMDIEALKSALTSEDEVKIKFKSGTFLDEEGMEDLKTRLVKNNGKELVISGTEQLFKAIKRQKDLNFEGKVKLDPTGKVDFDKTAELITSHYDEKVTKEAKIPIDKKNQDLTQSLENLQKKYETDLGLKDQELTGLKNNLKQTKINNELQQFVPEGIKGIKPNQAVILAKTEYDFDYSDTGQLIAMKNGKVLNDKLEKPIPVNDVLTDFAKNNGWLSIDGRGSGNNQGTINGFETMNDVYKHMEENKIDPMSSEGEQLIADFNNKK
jgi:hypothetical protein